jgi:nifR3 family TIM-barrel protein
MVQNLYKPIQIGSLSLKGNIFLAPVAGYSDRAFRSVCIEQGADFTYTELVSSEALTRNPAHYGIDPIQTGKTGRCPPAANILRRADNETVYCIQLFGANPDVMYRAAAALKPWQPACIDINAGCPVPKVTKTGAGSALMKTPETLGRIVEAVVRASTEHLGGIPVTVKMRSGWDMDSINYAECSRIAVEAGACMLTLHPRTRSQVYTGKSDWRCLADLVSRVSVPVAGSGDLFSPEDARSMLRETNAAAVMFARGAMGNPFIFAETRSLLETGSYMVPGTIERLRIGFRQLELLAADIGENAACREMRKQFCAYTKGIPGSAELRNRLVHAETAVEYREIMSEV